MTYKIISLLIAASLLTGIAAEAEGVDETRIITPQDIEAAESIEGEIIEHASLNPVYVDEAENEEIPSEDADIAPIAASDTSDVWDAMFSLEFGDSYNKPYRHNSSSTSVTDATNRLVIEETDLHLSGKNGLDFNLKRKYDNQYANAMHAGASGGIGLSTMYRVYAYTNTSTNETVNIAFLSNDLMHLYMYDEFCVSTMSDINYKVTTTISGTTIKYYTFDDIYKIKKADTGTVLKRNTETEPLTINITSTDNYYYMLNQYALIGNNNTLNDGWRFVLPAASLHVTDVDYNTKKTVYYRDYVGAFSDINGAVYSIKGNDIIYRDDVSSNSGAIQSVGDRGRSIKYNLLYEGNNTFKDTGRLYNFKAVTPDGYTYYFYCDNFEHSLATFNYGVNFYMNIIAVEDLYGNYIQYMYDNDQATGPVTKVIDTYGREINISRSDNSCTVSYTNESGAVKTIQYTKDTLSADVLDNDSPLQHKDVNLFSVTNQLGETIKYYSREAEILHYYMSSGNPDITAAPIGGHCAEITNQYNIERVVYPTGARTDYSYKCLGVRDSATKVFTQAYGVSSIRHIIDSMTENITEYSFANTDSNITKTEENSSAGYITVSEYNGKSQLTSSKTSSISSAFYTYYNVSYSYDTYGYPKTIDINNSGSSKTIKRTNSAEGRISKETIVGLRDTSYTYYGNGTVKTSTTSSDKYGTLKYTTTPNTVGDKPEYVQFLQGREVKSQLKYEYNEDGEVSAVKQWTNDTNADGVLDETDDILITGNDYEINNDHTLTFTTYADDVLNVDGENEGRVSNSYKLNMFGNPASKTDSYGTVAYIEYDDLNRPVKYTYANGSVTTVEYNLANLYTLITTPDGIKKKNIYDKLGRLIKVQRIYSGGTNTLEEYTYDGAGRLKTKSSYTDSRVGIKEEYTYDALSRIKSKTVYSLASGTPLLYTESYTYRPNKVAVTTTAADGTVTASIEEEYDSYDRLTSVKSTADDTTLNTTYTYDDFDRMISSTDANGNTTSYEYDCRGNVTKVTDAAGNATTTAYDLAGRVFSVTDADGNTSYAEYDKLGRKIRSTTPFTATTEAETKTYYDKNSNVVKTSVKRSNNVYQTEEYRYDVMGNLLGVIANDGTTDIVTQYEYDNANRMTKRITGLDSYSENPQGGSVTSYTYGSNGFLETETNPLGEELWYYIYDYVGNAKQVIEDYAYRDYTYGPFGMTSAYYHLRGETKKEYTYNSLGQLTGTTNSETPWGETTTTVTSESYTYDGFGRVKTHTASDGSVQSYTYDNNSNIVGYKLSKNGSTKNEISYSYNKLNQLTTLTKSGIITSYEYDNLGRLTNKTNDKGIGTAYTYNKAGLVTQVNNTANGKSVKKENSSYYLNGLKYQGSVLEGTDYRNLNYGYDDAGRLLYEYIWNSDDICYNEYSYDLRGNRISKLDVLSNESTSYTYDAADHLLQTDTTVNNTLTSRKLYTYDERGNLICEQSRSYSSDGLAGSKISIADGENETKFYSYDRFNRLTGYRCGTTEASYTYNADNLRATKTVNGTTTNYVWDGMNLMYEYGASNGSYAYDMTGILQNGTDTYMKDGHGSVIAKYDSKGNELSSAEYDAFGNIISGATEDPFGYCGEYLDSESGLIYLRNRYYDSATGRFITEDPARDGVNWYSYCAGNPVGFVDPWGLTIFSGYGDVNINGMVFNPNGVSIEISSSLDGKNQIDGIELIEQQGQDCWAATIAMCVNYYTGSNFSDMDIVDIEYEEPGHYNSGKNLVETADIINKHGFLSSIGYVATTKVTNKIGDVEMYGENYFLYIENIIASNIDAGNPIIMEQNEIMYASKTKQKHVVVIVGYDFSDQDNKTISVYDSASGIYDLPIQDVKPEDVEGDHRSERNMLTFEKIQQDF